MMYGYGNMITPSNRLFSGGGGGNPLWNGLIAYYTADNTPNDALGNYNGTLVNGATYGTGIINNGFYLDGVNDYVRLPDNMFKPTGDFTINCWLKYSSTGRIIQFSSEAPFNGIILYTFSGTNVRFGIGSSGTLSTFSAGTLSPTVMTMITFVRDSVANINYMYENGVEVGNWSSSVNPTYPATTIGTIGASSVFGTNFGGIGDEIALLDGNAWSSADVAEAYNGGLGLQYPN